MKQKFSNEFKYDFLKEMLGLILMITIINNSRYQITFGQNIYLIHTLWKILKIQLNVESDVNCQEILVTFSQLLMENAI